jgi:hypothetical protein
MGARDMSIKDIADRIRGNGYMPVPLMPYDKAIKIDGWTLLAAQDEYDQLWANASQNANIGIYTGQSVLICDFDAKGDAPSIEVYKWLLKNQPGVFTLAILEQTPSGGIHATYKWCSNAISLPTGKGKTYARFIINDKTYDVELLTRGSQAVCPPSATDKGAYKYLTEQTHLNTKREGLPVLPEIFRDANNSYLDAVMLANRTATPARQRNNTTKSIFTADEIELAVSELPDIYLKNARDGHRHFQALGLACNVAGVPGMGRRDVERAIESFFRGASREPNSSSEIAGIVSFGMAHPDSNPFIPAAIIYAHRRQSIVKKYASMGAVSNE